MHGGRMSEHDYTAAVSNTIIVCTDVVIINRERQTFYLAKRAAHPMKGIWWIGGRRHKGETPLEGIRFNFKRETGLDLPESRFTFVTILEYLWQDREQEPRYVGSHDLVHQFTVELTDEELAQVHAGLDAHEYDQNFGLQEFDRARLEAEGVYPTIIDVFNTIFKR